jgi:2-dehydro-3-deoxyglucarate aldolase
MNKRKSVEAIRRKLKRGQPSIGSWMQIPHGSVAEIMGASGFDWVAVDMEHGSISVAQLPDLFRALELGCTLPLARISNGTAQNCKEALDAGAAGVIVPNIQNAQQLIEVRDACRWPPAGKRGVGFCRANQYGRKFSSYAKEAQAPFLVAMIEDSRALPGLDAILKVEGLDAVLIGPYDLSASLRITGRLENPQMQAACRTILQKTKMVKVSCGVHVIDPSKEELAKKIRQGYRFLPYSIDSVMLASQASCGRGNP